MPTANDLQDFQLDILGQQARINRLYTQLTFCFKVVDTSAYEKIVQDFTQAARTLSESFPWIAGNVIRDHGTFKIKPSGKEVSVLVEDFRQTSTIPNWETIRVANFPFSMLDENDFAPCNTLIGLDGTAAKERPVFLVKLNLINGGLLVTFNAQHGAMDMRGQAEMIEMFAKACRKQPYNERNLSTGNTDRRKILPSLGENEEFPELNKQLFNSLPIEEPQSTNVSVPATSCCWAYFIFSGDALKALKALASETIPAETWISTDDALSAFIWHSITRARISRLTDPSVLYSTLSRNVDVRRFLSIPSSYPGMMTDSTLHSLMVAEIVERSLGSIALCLRSALDPIRMSKNVRAKASLVRKGEEMSRAAHNTPHLDVRLSSWAKENCYQVDFGIGSSVRKPLAVRRPRFLDGAREGLVYFLPKKLDGGITVGVCLRDEDLERLKNNQSFTRFCSYIG